MRLSRFIAVLSVVSVAPLLQSQDYGHIDANVTIIAFNPTSVRSDISVSYLSEEPHCYTNCVNELTGTHQIIQYGPGMVAGVYFRTTSATYRGTLYGPGQPQQCYHGLADQMMYTYTNAPSNWYGSYILATLNNIRSVVRCTPAATSTTPVSDPYGSSPDGAKTESPIVIDVAGAGYEFTSPDAGVTFDIRSSGTPVQMAWTDPVAGNAFLARDRSGNGRIDNGAELFGDRTPLASGQIAANGFVALAELDQNGDGVVDASDAGWATLLLWTDRNHDGRSTEEELQHITNTSIAALETDHQRIGKRDPWGNAFRFVARYRDRGGREYKYYDVYLRTAD